MKIKIELSKDEIKYISWAVSCLIYVIECKCFDWLNVSDKVLTDLKNIENKFDYLAKKADKE